MDPNDIEADKELEGLTAKLSENVAIEFTEEEIQQARDEFRNAVVVRMVGGRAYNKAVLKDVLRQSWRLIGGVRFVEVENNTLLAKFESEDEMEKVLQGRPWRYMGWAVMVERWKPGRNLDEMFSNKIQLWLQVHNLPVELRGDKYATRFAEKAGRVIRSGGRREGGNGTDERRIFARYLVEVDLLKPLVPGWELARKDNEPLWINFKYERLPNICFGCGRFDHEATSCLEGGANSSNRRFGPWLRAEHVAVERLRISDGRPWQSRQGADTDRMSGRWGAGGTQDALEVEESNHNQIIMRDKLETGKELLEFGKGEISLRIRDGVDKGKTKMGCEEVNDGPNRLVGLMLMDEEAESLSNELNVSNGPGDYSIFDGPGKGRGEKRKSEVLGVGGDKTYRRRGDKGRRNLKEADKEKLKVQDNVNWGNDGQTVANELCIEGAALAAQQPRRKP